MHVHCKDVRRAVLDRARADGMSFLDAVLEGIATVPGDGCIDFVPLLQRLAGHGYAGWLVVEFEQDPRKADLPRLRDFGLAQPVAGRPRRRVHGRALMRAAIVGAGGIARVHVS